MRIVSGIYKGRHFHAPDSLPVRPTTDLAKESLFNILQSRINFDSLKVLDLFSGIGSISFEFISRGAESVLCVDNYRDCIEFVRKQAAQWNMSGLKTLQQDVFKYLLNNTASVQFDFIFADPPYESDKIDKLPNLILSAHFLSPEGLLVIEHGKANDFSAHPNFIEERKYGKVHFSFFTA